MRGTAEIRALGSGTSMARAFCALAAAAAMPFAAAALEKIACIDTFDFAKVYDIERRSGCEKMLEHIARTGADAMAWRNQTGGMPRYRSAEERLPLSDMPFSKLRVPESREGYAWLKLDRGEVDLLAYPCEITAASGRTPAVHLTVEENHYFSFTFSTWVLEHPEFWCVMSNGTPWPGHGSFSYHEEIDHRIRLLDEILDRGVKLVFLGTGRQGGYGPRFEYTPVNVARWRSKYNCNPPKDWHDPKWIRHCGELYERFILSMARRCRQRGVRMIMGLRIFTLDSDEMKDVYGVDWRRLCAAGEIDGICFPYVDFRAPSAKGLDPWTATDRTYALAASLKGKADVYFAVNAYPGQSKNSFSDYAEATGLSKAECATRLLELAKKHGARGVVLQIVDYGNYPEDVCKAIRDFK
ncbi:MAG: hypothetical protein IKO72_07695 [Kiritimatiellae bacterium]|nr:hypothetical protein [Kiritimatiellia bacterium]